jgi:hypothetical protein
MTTEYAGIDYGLGKSNIDTKTGIRYGVINQNEVLQAWADSSEPFYASPWDCCFEMECLGCGKDFMVPEKDIDWGDMVPCPTCGEENEVELPDMADPSSYFIEDADYSAECGDDGDIFITKSPYYTHCQFCSPCAPGAGYLMNPVDNGVKTYCFDHSWFDNDKAPYPVYWVDSDEEVKPPCK